MYFLTLIAACAGLVAASPQLPSMPKMPVCAQSCITPVIKSSGCKINTSIVACICKSPAVTMAIKECAPKACTETADVTAFKKVINDACTGKAGFTAFE